MPEPMLVLLVAAFLVAAPGRGADRPPPVFPRVTLVATLAPAALRVQPREPGQFLDLVDGTLLGTLAVAESWTDFRGQEISAGSYELRYYLQPRSKHHAGVDAARDFAVLVPAIAAGSPGPTDTPSWIEISRQISRTSHPAILALAVPADTAAAPPASAIREGDRWVVYRRLGSRTLGLVLAGQAPPPAEL
jgi:hypothetical protein